MQQTRLTILENSPLTGSVFRLRLAGDFRDPPSPGQFVDLRIPGLYLRRPVSVCDWTDGILTLICKVVGHGTDALSRMAPGESLDALSFLGNGYDLSCCGDRPVLLGGGVGVPPLYLLAKKLLEKGRNVTVCLGFNSASEVFYDAEFRALGAEVRLATADGSRGFMGFTTDLLPDRYSYFYACGPEPMLRAACRAACTGGQLSFEARMGCGFGACMGCSVRTLSGYKRICRDGPVLRKEEILWQT